jgi:hypothetical protein
MLVLDEVSEVDVVDADDDVDGADEEVAAALVLGFEVSKMVDGTGSEGVAATKKCTSFVFDDCASFRSSAHNSSMDPFEAASQMGLIGKSRIPHGHPQWQTVASLTRKETKAETSSGRLATGMNSKLSFLGCCCCCGCDAIAAVAAD